MYIEDWFDETKVEFTERMDGLDCSKLFATITEEERKAFFTEWIKCRGEKEYIVYDITSISTYSGNLDLAEWGYNRDQESLPQVNLGLYYGVSSHMPVYYNMFSGSIPDKVYLEFMMANAKDMGLRCVCFVIDRGFVTEDNFNCMRENGYSFITAMPGQRLEALRLVDENKGRIRKAANRIDEYEVYGLQCPIELYGLQLQAHIYYDPEKQAFDEKELFARIEKLRAELEKMNKSKRLTKKYKDYFVIEEKTLNELTFELDTNKVDERLERAGFFILLSSQAELTSGEVLKIYRDRDIIEKNFEQFKNRLDFKRMRTHWNKTTEGKLFVGFLALILRSYMRQIMKTDPRTKSLTFEKILIELRKIKSVTMTDLSEMLIPLTKLQKTILAILGIPIEPLAN
jgi:transposase